MFQVVGKYYIGGIGYGFVPEISQDMTILRSKTKFQNQRTGDIFTVGYVECGPYDIERGPHYKVGEPNFITIKTFDNNYTKSKQIFENTNIGDVYCITAD